MKNKKTKVQMHLLYTLCYLLIGCLDKLKCTTPKMEKFKSDLTGMCEELGTDAKDTFVVQKTTYFQEISTKINSLIRNNFNENY